MEAFLLTFREFLVDMKSEEYMNYVDGLISEVLRPDNNLNEHSRRYWREIQQYDILGFEYLCFER